MPGVHTEQTFEDAIEAHLLANGWLQGSPDDFDPITGIGASDLFVFLSATQLMAWSNLVKSYANDETATKDGFRKRLTGQLDERGTLDVLRHGVVDRGVTLQLAFFKPAHSLTPELVERYEANRATLVRQLHYEATSEKSIDLCLMLNGIPVATAELKNPITGQSIEHAITQYRNDRDPRNLTRSKRALVHFAVDPERVAMTTKLAGPQTQFIPFNRGNDREPGNPPNPNGHATSYLWEDVWKRDNWLDILARFTHVERPTTGSAAARRAAEKVIFPRYHQWDAVLKIEADAKSNGAGKSYLIEHSAGSGKSNTIAWTAHRLSTLHDKDDNKIFDKVVVITDRIVLDRQLQDTVFQFEHVRGVVEKIDENATQLANALAGEQARIIITTLQKFPFVLDKVHDLPNRKYAVLVDEAHSSQTGEAAKDLRLVLGGTEETELTAAEAEDAGFISSAEDPVEEALARAVGARGRQDNLSFFAFTATPKARTLELFGTFNTETGKFEPFHLYSMRQAIGEGFILDVLANYTTYKTYWRIEKAITDDPNYDPRKAKAAIARFVDLHPYNLAQKAEIIIEHFRAHTASKIGGQAKAMVVTSSRLHALRYKRAIDYYISTHGYSEIATLVAFSGRVFDDGDGYTEQGVNGFPESQTAARFGTADYQVLIVAEKFQTGFDQPLLHTMYVDKVLTGLNAVQTLSRLNRIHSLKNDTFILDFRNDTGDIVKSFEPYYGMTVAPPTEPNLLYDTRRALDDYDVMRIDEIEDVVKALLTSTDSSGHGALYSGLDPAIARFHALPDEDRVSFKNALDKFVRTYSFLSQIVSFTDTSLERDYLYCRALASCLRDAASIERLDLGSEVELSHLKVEMTFEGSLALEAEAGEVSTLYGEGRGKQTDVAPEPLSHIVEILNERFGLELDDADRLLFDQFEEEWVSDPTLASQARENTLDNFKLVFDPKFLSTIVGRMDDNEAIFKQILDDTEFRQVLADYYLKRVYERTRENHPA
ncbi:MAG: DEAD/DEAH box helicase family protein [Acidimicrobiales bacterium]